MLRTVLVFSVFAGTPGIAEEAGPRSDRIGRGAETGDGPRPPLKGPTARHDRARGGILRQPPASPFPRPGGTTILLALGGHAEAGPDDGTPGEQLKALRAEWDRARGEATAILSKAQGDGDRARALERLGALNKDILRRTVELAERAPADPSVLDAITAMLLGKLGGFIPETVPEFDRAFALLTKRYAGDEKITAALRVADRYSDRCAGTEGLLRAALERSPHRSVRGVACFCLARQLRLYGEWAATLRSPDASKAKEIRQLMSVAVARRLDASDPAALRKEAEGLFEQVVARYADAEYPGGGNRLGVRAEGELFRMRHLEVGKTAPELAGEDIDGRPMKLSDQRGRVVVVVFWATWCGPCMREIPHEKELVERMRGERFVLLGVNGDYERTKAKDAIREEGITWRSWWGGGPDGPIATAWAVSSYPASFVIDGKGVVRHRDLRAAELDKAVDELVREAKRQDD